MCWRELELAKTLPEFMSSHKINLVFLRVLFKAGFNDWLRRDPSCVFYVHCCAYQHSFDVPSKVIAYGAGIKHIVKITNLIFTHLYAIRFWHGFFYKVVLSEKAGNFIVDQMYEPC